MKPKSAESDRGGARWKRAGWHPSLRQQLIGLVVIFGLVAGAGALYQRVSSVNDAVTRTRQALVFRADLAAGDIDNAVALTQRRIDGYAALLAISGIPSNSGKCQFGSATAGPFLKGHTDVVRSDGTVACSSAAIPDRPIYAGADWLHVVAGAPHTGGPFQDPALGAPTIVVAAPIKGIGVVATFLDLDGVADRLSARLSGPVNAQFSFTQPGTPPVARSGQIDVVVPLKALGWTFHAATPRDEAVAVAISLSDRLLWYLLIAFVVLLAAVQLLYVAMGRPIRRLSEAVRGVVPGDVPTDLARSGPAEVVSLGEAFMALTRAVSDELSQRRQAQAAQALAEKERGAQAAMLDLVVQSSPALIYVKDLDGRYLVVNAAYERATGFIAAEVLGKTDLELSPKLTALWRDNDIRAREGLFHLKEELTGPEGTRHYESAKFPLHDASGTQYAVCGVSLDVTEQQNAIEATAKARDAALAANAAKSAFLATMSHEIRTPMNAVIGMTELLGQTELDPQQIEFVDTVRSSGEALLAVINDILDFSKIESGEMELEVAPFVLREEVESCLDMVASQAAAKGIALLCFVGDSCPTRVSGDAVRLRQVLTNLLANAVKFTERGEILVEVECVDVDSDHHGMTLTVTDTGIGISAESRERLFRSFSQVDTSTTRIYGGTGLGLAISQRLAKAMGGSITVTDNPKTQGSRFIVTVILTKCRESSFARGRLDVTAQVLAGRSVLLVDDNETNLRILDLQLSRLGLACTVATNGDQALKLVAGGLSYDVGILDMNMPDMDGVELGNSLKQLPGLSAGSPLILLTSIGGRPDGTEHSFSAMLTKPVKSTSLRDALTTFLVRQPAGRPDNGWSSAGEENQPRRILLAEDNLVNQRVVQLMLKSLGHTVDIVGDGAAAVSAVEEQRYDVVLMDVQMPKMDGLEATRRIRADVPRGQQPHIVALTASALVEDREACAAAGMEAYLTKPIRKKDLQAMLDRTTSSAVPVGSP